MASILDTPIVDVSTSQPDSALKVLFALFCQSSTWDGARMVFDLEGRRILEAAKRIRPDRLSQKVSGDGARAWSIEMVLEHLIEVGTVHAEVIVHLSHDESPWHEMDPVTALPDGGVGARILDDFAGFLGDFAGVLTEDIGRCEAETIHEHPCYGQLTAHGWLCLAAFHQRMHRDQVERIAAALAMRTEMRTE